MNPQSGHIFSIRTASLAARGQLLLALRLLP